MAQPAAQGTEGTEGTGEINLSQRLLFEEDKLNEAEKKAFGNSKLSRNKFVNNLLKANDIEKLQRFLEDNSNRLDKLFSEINDEEKLEVIREFISAINSNFLQNTIITLDRLLNNPIFKENYIAFLYILAELNKYEGLPLKFVFLRPTQLAKDFEENYEKKKQEIINFISEELGEDFNEEEQIWQGITKRLEEIKKIAEKEVEREEEEEKPLESYLSSRSSRSSRSSGSLETSISSGSPETSRSSGSSGSSETSGSPETSGSSGSSETSEYPSIFCFTVDLDNYNPCLKDSIIPIVKNFRPCKMYYYEEIEKNAKENLEELKKKVKNKNKKFLNLNIRKSYDIYLFLFVNVNSDFSSVKIRKMIKKSNPPEKLKITIKTFKVGKVENYIVIAHPKNNKLEDIKCEEVLEERGAFNYYTSKVYKTELTLKEAEKVNKNLEFKIFFICINKNVNKLKSLENFRKTELDDPIEVNNSNFITDFNNTSLISLIRIMPEIDKEKINILMGNFGRIEKLDEKLIINPKIKEEIKNKNEDFLFLLNVIYFDYEIIENLQDKYPTWNIKSECTDYPKTEKCSVHKLKISNAQGDKKVKRPSEVFYIFSIINRIWIAKTRLRPKDVEPVITQKNALVVANDQKKSPEFFIGNINEINFRTKSTLMSRLPSASSSSGGSKIQIASQGKKITEVPRRP
jgi:hypothetical protein